MDREEHIVVDYAGFWRRLGAIAIDSLAILSINWLLVTPWRLALISSRMWQSDGWIGPFPAYDPLSIFTLFIVAFYFVFFWAWRGQTPGKIILNIKVLKEDGTQLTLSYSIMRFFGYLVCGLTLGVGFLALAFDERRQGLHDKIASTVVVKVPPVKMRLPEASTGRY